MKLLDIATACLVYEDSVILVVIPEHFERWSLEIAGLSITVVFTVISSSGLIKAGFPEFFLTNFSQTTFVGTSRGVDVLLGRPKALTGGS